jgi:hypothetical protein
MPRQAMFLASVSPTGPPPTIERIASGAAACRPIAGGGRLRTTEPAANGFPQLPTVQRHRDELDKRRITELRFLGEQSEDEG